MTGGSLKIEAVKISSFLSSGFLFLCQKYLQNSKFWKIKKISLLPNLSSNIFTIQRVYNFHKLFYRNVLTWWSWVWCCGSWWGGFHRAIIHPAWGASVMGQGGWGNRGTRVTTWGTGCRVYALFFLPPGKTQRKPFFEYYH